MSSPARGGDAAQAATWHPKARCTLSQGPGGTFTMTVHFCVGAGPLQPPGAATATRRSPESWSNWTPALSVAGDLACPCPADRLPGDVQPDPGSKHSLPQPCDGASGRLQSQQGLRFLVCKVGALGRAEWTSRRWLVQRPRLFSVSPSFVSSWKQMRFGFGQAVVNAHARPSDPRKPALQHAKHIPIMTLVFLPLGLSSMGQGAFLRLGQGRSGHPGPQCSAPSLVTAGPRVPDVHPTKHLLCALKDVACGGEVWGTGVDRHLLPARAYREGRSQAGATVATSPTSPGPCDGRFAPSTGARTPEGAEPPRFIKEPKDQIGVSGGVASFVCQATGDPKPRVTWNKKGKKVNSQRFETIEFDESAGAVLRIQPLRTPRDENVYECVAQNAVGEITVHAKLTVLRVHTGASDGDDEAGPPRGPVMPPALPQPCSLSGSGLFQGGPGSEPTARQVAASTADLYELPARRPGPELAVTGRLVGSDAALRAWGSLPEDQLPPGFPNIDMGPQLKVVERTRTATMLCAASGNPDPEITWFKDFLPVDPSASNGRIKQLRSESTPIRGALQIESSEETDQGKYECVATNSAGVRSSSPANLYVRDPSRKASARARWDPWTNVSSPGDGGTLTPPLPLGLIRDALGVGAGGHEETDGGPALTTQPGSHPLALDLGCQGLSQEGRMEGGAGLRVRGRAGGTSDPPHGASGEW
ncbi:Receptor-type tyrosine-protein phosphatase S [Tupaia chinensis]|uniref:Receptor-type tyrosine-protein phosphatase S n=1 Tax=Tupaia chinensis TaxID=246437 RepID=L9KK22_TUPCH|nr:Receptor-type tyrosine-protein phosphatase S [Tupaia chinensis]